jgi:alkanesulfonate monooxygenase SsuD/methylene tetrahydromethanopterin reductase-like flavin-dependent oxidoreductase (luciferase family)
MLADVLASSAIGSPDTVRRALSSFIDRTRPDELMLTSQIFDHAARLRSYEIAADVLNSLPRPEARAASAPNS